MPPVVPNRDSMVDSENHYVIREALPSDMEEIHRMITGLAVYEKMPDQVKITPETLRFDAFGEGHPPRFFAYVAERVGSHQLAGYSIVNERYSTWTGRTLWIEDIYVSEEHRRHGIGREIFKTLAARAERDNLSRIEWNVLGWNSNAIRFYKKIGGIDMTLDEEWHTFRLTKELYEALLK